MDGVNLRVRDTHIKTNDIAAAQPILPISPTPISPNDQPRVDFRKALDTAIVRQERAERNEPSRPVHFSKHANMRLSARQINLTREQLSRVEEGLSKATEKGIRDSLVLVDDVALVVNVKSKTVITAIDAMKQGNVFSNIDGAVIV
jgi:flagellar operon protein